MEERSRALTGKPHQISAASHEETATETMSDGEIFKAEKVYIADSVAKKATHVDQTGTTLHFKLSLDHVNASQTEPPPSVSAQSENTPDHEASGTASMETAADKRRSISQRQCQHASGLSETHKIKLSYKSLAAIPTNTLLQEQQAIDEQVEREDRSPYDTLDRGVTPDMFATDTHAEMCSPAQLRQQSEELYAVIDEVLANSIPPSSRSSTPSAGLQLNNSSFPKSLGRETKYASICSLHSSSAVDRDLMDPKKTRPGIIRPMTAIPRLMVEDEEEFHPNPFRRFDAKRTLSDIATVEGRARNSQTQVFSEERKPERRTLFSVCDLQITEPEDQIGDSVKHL